MFFRMFLVAAWIAVVLSPWADIAFANDDDSEHAADEYVLPRVSNAAYAKECSACHMAYQPGLLPERSWRKIMESLDDHFGDNAALDDASGREILDYLTANSAEHSTAEVSRKILASIPSGATPIRISETGYIVREHREIAPSVFKRQSIGSVSRCNACHTTATEGNYEERHVKIPR